MSVCLELKDLYHRYNSAGDWSLADLSLQVEPGELVALLGPSGCGKTTALKIIAGLLRPLKGDVLVDRGSILQLPPERRRVAMVFQKPLLFPHMDVASNVGFGLKMRGVFSTDEMDRRVSEALHQVHMEAYADRKPDEISGGQQQRVALARALVIRPSLLLLDEPLSALDANLREDMRELVKRLHREGGYTTVFVTHDQEEAVVLADRIALLFNGRLQMYDRPRAFYDRPADRRIAEFFGTTNFLRGEVADNVIQTPLGLLKLVESVPAGEATVTVRPESVRLGRGENSFPARISSAVYLGTQVLYTLNTTSGLQVKASLPPHMKLRVGEEIIARLPPESLWVLRS